MSSKVKELTAPEIRRLIKAHNTLTKIAVPKGSKKADLVKLIQDAGFKLDHVNKKIIKVRKGKQDISEGTEIKVPAPPPKKTKEEKEKAKKATAEKKAQARIKTLKDAQKQAEALKKLKAVRMKMKKKKAPAKKSPPLLLGDKSKPPPEKTTPFKKSERAKLNKAFKVKYGRNIWDALEMKSTSTPSPAEVKKVCRKLQLKNHPDKGGDEEDFKAIREACEIYVKTFLKEGEEPENEISATDTETQKTKISEFIKKYSASAIKKLDTMKKVEDAFSDGQDLYNEIQQRFVNEMKMKTMTEMRDWFLDNMSKKILLDYTQTEKLLKRRINAQYRKLAKK